MLEQLFPITTISNRIGPAVRRWPAGSEVIRFVLDDAEFTDPALAVMILIQLSKDNKVTWFNPIGGPVLWRGGVKAHNGDPVSVTIGPYVYSNVIINPTHARFFAEPGPSDGHTGGGPPYGPPVRVGLKADVSPDS